MVHTIEVKAKLPKITTKKTTWLNRYWAYCDSYKDSPIIWYLIPLITFSAITIPIVVCLLYFLELPYLWVLSFSVLLFYANIIANIGGWDTRVTISTYWITTLIIYLIPMISWFIF